MKIKLYLITFMSIMVYFLRVRSNIGIEIGIEKKRRKRGTNFIEFVTQLVRQSAPEVSRAERHKFEARLTRYFLSVPFHFYS